MNEPTDKQDDAEFDAYLKGDSALSGSYQNDAKETPSAALDAAILKAARSAPPASSNSAGPIPQRWLRPLSVAAVVVLSVTLITYIQLEENIPASTPAEEYLRAPQPAEESVADSDVATEAPRSERNELRRQQVVATPKREEKAAAIDPAAYEQEPAPRDAREAEESSADYGAAITRPSEARLTDEVAQAANDNRVQADSAPSANTAVAEEPDRVLVMREPRSPEAERSAEETPDQTDALEAIVVTGARAPQQGFAGEDDATGSDDNAIELLEEIATLWSQGEAAEAQERLAEFDALFPDYDADIRRQLLPEALLESD